jgi:hypothetical protein
MYLVRANEAAVGRIRFDKSVQWAAGQTRQVDDTEIKWYQENSSVFTVLDGPGASAADQGGHAIGYIDFDTGAFQATKTITIGGIVFTEADPAVVANGVFTNGASAAQSAASLILAINGDTRAGSGIFTAHADASGDGVVVVWDDVGVPSGGVVIATGGTNSSIETPAVHGVAPSQKKVAYISHTVTTQQLKAGAITIPVPFVPTGFMAQCWTAGVLTPSITDIFTIIAAPNAILVTVDGAVHAGNGVVIKVIAWE